MQRRTHRDHPCDLFMRGGMQTERAPQRMPDQEHPITALLEQVELALYSSHPFRPAKRKHSAHMTSMTRQQDILRNHAMRTQPLLNLRHISSAAIQATNQQGTYDRCMCGMPAFLWHIHWCRSLITFYISKLIL